MGIPVLSIESDQLNHLTKQEPTLEPKRTQGVIQLTCEVVKISRLARNYGMLCLILLCLFLRLVGYVPGESTQSADSFATAQTNNE